MDLRGMAWADMDWLDLGHEKDIWRAFVSAVMNLRDQ